MARVLPSSLTPHVCILPSPDLSELLESSSLPPLPEILQSFSPLPQVTTRTTTWTSVPHATFALRFSDLVEIEEACREDEERRATRVIDWISGRIAKRCARWVSEVEGVEGKELEKGGWKTPWWDEVRRCAEGDHVPSKHEGWNHPVAVIYAASTTAPNALQAITALHARPLQFPTWVDPHCLKYTLIIHPQNSPLSDEEATALFNAVTKQFGLDVYLLSLTLPSPPPPPVPVPLPIARLHRPTIPESPPMMRNATKRGATNGPVNASSDAVVPNSLRMLQDDIQATSKFARKFVVGCLIPWMERNVLEWSEAFSNNRRLPSRLFSSTRKLFGTPSPSSTPVHHPSSSVVTLSRSSTSSITGTNTSSPPPQQRRLAEFATVLGDYKLAVTVWESLRKDSKGGSDILPILLSPSPALSLHASNSLASIHVGNDSPPQAQVRALLLAVRWETGSTPQDFLSDVMEGERWLVWAAGNSEEVPAAMLIAHAAYLTSKKGCNRRAAYWYAIAASRLEKCGIKPLTMHFLRKAQELYRIRSSKELSPSFWLAEGKDVDEHPWVDAVMAGIEHPLGRLLYTTGDILSAVKLFLGLLRGSDPLTTPGANNGPEGEAEQPSTRDKLFLDDFRVAFGHLKATEPEKVTKEELKLPLRFCQSKQSRLRFVDDSISTNAAVWEKRAEDWRVFWKLRGGKEGFADSGDAVVGEMFWVDLALRNPLDTEVNLSDLTLIVEAVGSSHQEALSQSLVDVDTIEDVILGAGESRVVSFSVTVRRSGTFTISQAKYNFLSLLPSTEPLSTRGRRLNATPAQRQEPTYAPDVFMKVNVIEGTHKLAVSFVEIGKASLLQGENRTMDLWLSNMSARPIREIWMVPDPEDEIWVGDYDEGPEEDGQGADEAEFEVVTSSNSLLPPTPLKIPIPGDVLAAEEGMNLPLTLHMETPGQKEFCLFFVYREGESDAFHTARVSRTVDVQPVFHLTSAVEPDQSSDGQLVVNVSLRNLSSSVVHLTQLSTLSPLWSGSPVAESLLSSLPPAQCSNITLKAKRWTNGKGSHETTEFVKDKLNDILNGRPVGKMNPPPIDLCCAHFAELSRTRKTAKQEIVTTFIHGGRRNFMSRHISDTHPHIPSTTHPYIFPLYNPTSFDVVLFWEIDSTSISPSLSPSPSLSLSDSRFFRSSRRRLGHVTIHGLTLGATHAPLQGIIEEIENAKVKRIMFAETVKENSEVLEAIRGCEWNMEMNPLDGVVQDMGEVTHDFSTGPCWTSAAFIIRNYSLTHEAGFTLRLRGATNPRSVTSRVLPPPYTGRLSFRGTIPPSKSLTFHPKMWISRPGMYSLDGWKLDTEIYENDSTTQPELTTCTLAPTTRKVRHRYSQERPVSDRTCLVVRDTSRVS